jgi:hypothetical protein
MIGLQIASLASQWLSSLMMLGWAPVLPVAETRKPRRGEPVLKRFHQVIATPGSNIIRVVPTAIAYSVAPTTNVHDGSAEIVAFAQHRGRRRP